MKFNHTAHKGMWTWLAENPKMDKDEWPGWEWNGGVYNMEATEHCFVCLYVKEISGAKGDPCSYCPLKFPEPCYCGDSLFRQWRYCNKKLGLRSSLALQIANLPVKEGVEIE